jgi:hypothetical protein
MVLRVTELVAMKQNTYTILIHTGDDVMGGTDAPIFLQLFGTTGQTDEIYLPARDIFSFEAGSTDKYILEVPDVGELTRCCLRLEASEPSVCWLVKDVQIADDETSRVWTFVFNCWLGQQKAGTLTACATL